MYCSGVCKWHPIVPSAGWSTIKCYIIWSYALFFWLFSSSSLRAPEPQKPQTRVGNDVVRSNHYDPDEDEEYYRKQLSYFDRRSFDNKPMSQPNTGVNRFHEPPKTPQPQIAYPFPRYRLVLETQYLLLNGSALVYVIHTLPASGRSLWRRWVLWTRGMSPCRPSTRRLLPTASPHLQLRPQPCPNSATSRVTMTLEYIFFTLSLCYYLLSNSVYTNITGEFCHLFPYSLEYSHTLSFPSHLKWYV